MGEAMRKVKYFFTIMSSFFLLHIVSYSQTNELFSYFPLEVGNKWFFSWTLSIDNSIRTILEATTDTLMPDGKEYTIIERMDKNETSWDRIAGYFYLRVENNVLYEFPSDTLFNYNWNDNTSISELNYNYQKVHVENKMVFGMSRLTYYLYVFEPYEYVSYTDSIGFNALYALEYHDWSQESRYLVGCIIDNKYYGNVISNINFEEKPEVSDFIIFQNYPNPFNPTTSIQYKVSSIEWVSLKVYDILGRQIATLVNEEKPEGNYVVTFNEEGLPSGVYFYSLQAGDFYQTKKMLLLK